MAVAPVQDRALHLAPPALHPLRDGRPLPRRPGRLRPLPRVRRLPELRYDLYVLSDHGQAPTRPFTEVSGGVSIEGVVLAAFSPGSRGLGPRRLRGLARWLQAYRRTRGLGLYQRDLTYMEG